MVIATLQRGLEVVSMTARLYRPDITPQYVIKAFTVFSTAEQRGERTFEEHFAHLKRFLTSHIRNNYALLKAAEGQQKHHNPNDNLPRHRA